MKKFWNWIVSFFGFGAQESSKKERLGHLLAAIGSQEKMNDCKQKAFQIVQTKDPLQPGQAHPYESLIKGDCIIADAAITEYHNEALSQSFGDAQYLIMLINNGIDIELSNASSRSVNQKITSQIALSSPEVDKLKRDLTVAKKELAIFKGANGLGAAANYPESRSNALYFIIGAAILEAIFNIAFLREQLDGYMALLVAIGVAAMNVGVNVWFGIKSRFKNHIDKSIASKGRLYQAYAFAAIIILNSGIAYIRYKLMPDDQGLSPQFLLESALLYFVGIILGVTAFNKGYGLDDPYPDYGRMSRNVDFLEREITGFAMQHAAFCEAIKAAATSDHQSIKQRIHSSANSLRMTLPEMSKSLHEWSAQRNQLTHIYAQLQEIFKGIIIAHHPEGNAYPLELSQLTENAQLLSHQTQVTQFIDQKNEVQDSVDRLIAEVETSDDELHRWFTGLEAQTLWRWPN